MSSNYQVNKFWNYFKRKQIILLNQFEILVKIFLKNHWSKKHNVLNQENLNCSNKFPKINKKPNNNNNSN